RELSRVVAAHRNLQRYLIHSRFAFIAPPHQLGIEHERIAIEALSPVVACQAASRQSDFPREGFIIREPAAQQFVARPLGLEHVEDATAARSQMPAYASEPAVHLC